MKPFPRILLALITAALMLGACGGQEPEQPEYQTFTNEEANFSADFPGEPRRESRTENAGDVRLNLVHFSVDNGDEAVSVSYIDYPQAIAEQDPTALLDSIAEGAAGAADGNIEGADSELVSKTPTTFEGHQAIDFEVDIDDRELQARAILVGTRMYLMQVVREPDVDDTSYERLIESFELLEAPSPTPPAEESPAPEESPAAEESPAPAQT